MRRNVTVELEGTWEEIAAHAAELAGQQVRVTVVTAEGSGQHPLSANRAMLAALRQAEGIQEGMAPTSGGDTQAYIREARSGAMYGYEPAE